jgi:prepilin-type N-terminal cleavage/methylation domain-containing protein
MMTYRHPRPHYNLSVHGFTLIELLVVVLIIGILAAIALPQYKKAVIKSNLSEALMNIKSFAQADMMYMLIHGEPALKFTDLDIELPGELSEAEAGQRLIGKKFIYWIPNDNPFQISISPYTDYRLIIWAQMPASPSGHIIYYCRANRKFRDLEEICISLGGSKSAHTNDEYYYQQL